MTLEYKLNSQPSKLISAALIEKILKIIDGVQVGAICAPKIVKNFDGNITPIWGLYGSFLGYN